MRTNTEQAINAMDRREKFGKRGDGVWCDGTTIYSYNTAIATVHPTDGHSVIINVTKYSTITSKHQNRIVAATPLNLRVIVDDIARNAEPHALWRAAGINK